MSPKDRHFKWYVVVDSATNEAVARELAAANMAAESEVVSFTDNTGTAHKGWLVDFQFISRLEKAKRSFPFDFKVFVQEGNGRPRFFPGFKRRTSKKVAAAKKQLTEMSAAKAKRL